MPRYLRRAPVEAVAMIAPRDFRILSDAGFCRGYAGEVLASVDGAPRTYRSMADFLTEFDPAEDEDGLTAVIEQKLLQSIRTGHWEV